MARTSYPVIVASAQPASQTEVTHPPAYAAVLDTSDKSKHNFNYASELILSVAVHSQPTGSLPTLDVKLQESFDEGATWVDIDGAAVAQFTGGSQTETKVARIPGPAVTDAKTFGPLIRIMAAIGGTTPVYSVTYRLYPKE